MEKDLALKHFRGLIDQCVKAGCFSSAKDVITMDEAYTSIVLELDILQSQYNDALEKIKEYERSKPVNANTE